MYHVTSDNPFSLCRDGQIAITPFNLKDEEEDGTFDRDGTFVWKKSKEDVTDSWLDNVDWGKVR